MKTVMLAVLLSLSLSSAAMATGNPFPWLKGDKGDQGEQGVQGETGATGATGANGANGADGTNGANGVDGRDGANGSNGQAGTKGDAGDAGEDGVDGTNGLNGKDGNDVNAQRAISSLANTVQENRELAAAGVASAIAQASIPQAIRNGSSLVGVGAGYFDGEQAIAVGASHRFDGGKWNVKGSVGFTSKGNSAGVGVGYEF